MIPGIAKELKRIVGECGRYVVVLESGREVCRCDNAGLAVQAADLLEEHGAHAYVVSGGWVHYASHRVPMHKEVAQ